MFTGLHGGGGEYAAALVQGTDGNFYGTVLEGGTFNHGTVFKITPSGTLTTLHNFSFTDGILPSGLVQASDGNFYGTTPEGGTNSCLSGGTNYGCGTLYKITPSGTVTTLCTTFVPKAVARTAKGPTARWSRAPTGTCAEQRAVAGPPPVPVDVERSSKSRQPAR